MNKIHHKTLEAMKRRGEEVPTDVTQTIPSNEVASDTQVLVDKATLDRQAALIESLATRLANVEQEAKTPKVEVSKGKIYEGPLKLSYYLYQRENKLLPIVEYYSKKRKEEYSGLTFKNIYGVIENNQIVVLTLADGDTKEVDPLYLAEAEASEPQVPKYIIDKFGVRFDGTSDSIWAVDDQKRRNFLKQIAAFVFDTEWGEITIPMKLVASSKNNIQ